MRNEILLGENLKINNYFLCYVKESEVKKLKTIGFFLRFLIYSPISDIKIGKLYYSFKKNAVFSKMYLMNCILTNVDIIIKNILFLGPHFTCSTAAFEKTGKSNTNSYY